MLLLVIPLLTVVAVYLFLHHHYTYWKRRGIPQLNPSYAFGDFGPVLRQGVNLADFFQDLYLRTKKHHPLLGIYILFRPALLVNDLAVARDIMKRAFRHFQDRGVYVDEENDLLSGHLFALGGEKWHQMHQKFAPAFTPLKLKEIFQTQLATATTLRDHLQWFAKSGETVDVVSLILHYTTDTIASIAFGAEIDSVNHPDEPFYKIAYSCVESNMKNMLRWTGSFLVPSLLKLTKTRLIEENVEQFIMHVIRQTVEFRERNNVARRDTLQCLLKLKGTGSTSKTISIQEIACLAFTFLLAGMETSSSSAAFCLYEIAKNPEIQLKLQKEIDETLQLNAGQFTYDGVTSMTFLDNCVNEIFRKFPALAYLHRICTKDYPIPETQITIKKGTLVLIPLYAVQRDPEFFPHPNDFFPDRFADPENIRRAPYFPFGEGPRQCIGQRMGKMNVKIALVVLLACYNFQLANPDDRLREPQIDPEHFTIFPKGRIDMQVTHRKCSSPRSHSMSLTNHSVSLTH